MNRTEAAEYIKERCFTAYPNTDDSLWDKAMVTAIKALEQPEQRWIPVTERLPPKYIGEWLCCTDDGRVMALPYDTPGDGTKECIFYKWDDNGYYYEVFNVVAWMPLPEPWKGEQK